MTRYEFLRKNKAKIKQLCSQGYASTKAIVDIDIYEQYLKNKTKYKTRMMSYQVTADKNKISLRTVMRTVKGMEEKI